MLRLTTAALAIAAVVTAAEPQLVRVDAAKLENRVVKRALPVYPQVAVQGHIEGVVRFAVRVNTEGQVARAVLISGHPLLLDAARTAVVQYRYRPMLVNGRRVEMTGLVDIVFELPLPPGTRVAAAASSYRA